MLWNINWTIFLGYFSQKKKKKMLEMGQIIQFGDFGRVAIPSWDVLEVFFMSKGEKKRDWQVDQFLWTV